jgi:hypothetical protein
MRVDFKDRPRVFTVKGRKIKDYGKICLRQGEMFSLRTKSGRDCDITAFGWGFYLGSSLNSRLRKEGFKVALVLNQEGRLFLNAVERTKIKEFNEYLRENQNSKVVCWLDELT